MSSGDVKSFFGGVNINTLLGAFALIGLFWGFGATWQKQVSQAEEQKRAIELAVEQMKMGDAAAAATAHAEVESVRTDLARDREATQKWITNHETSGRDRLQANTAAQTRLDAEIEAVRTDASGNSRKLDQHEYRLTNAESQISQVRQTLDKITEKIDAIDRNVLLLAQRAGVQPDDDTPGTIQGKRR